MTKGMLIPIFMFGLLKLFLTLLITYESIDWQLLFMLLILIVINLYILICLIAGKWFFSRLLKLALGAKYEKTKKN